MSSKVFRFGLSILIVLASLTGCLGDSGNPRATDPAHSSLNLGGPVISPLLVGNNVWMYPDGRVWSIAGQAGLRIIRIGGTAYDQNMPSTSMLTGWVENIKAMGAEPMIQVSRFGTAEAAAELVKFFNLETGNKVTYWNIGNEPYCNKVTPTTAGEVAKYIKPIAAAMKAIDPTIRIFAPDECDFYDAFYATLLAGDDGPADISGKVPGKNYYYIDGISWHRYVGYPPENIGIDRLTTEGANDYLVRIQKTRTLVDKVNGTRGRRGLDALQWGIGEFNSSDGKRVCSFENGQMFAEVYGFIMKYGGTYGETWSMFENGGNCLGTDFSFVDGKMQPRSSFYHMQMVSNNLSGSYLDGTSTLEGIRAFGSIDSNAGTIAVMLLNIDPTAAHTCSLRLDSNLSGAGDCQVNIPAGLAVNQVLAIGSQTSLVLVFDLQGKLVKTVTYSKGDTAPQTVFSP
jgi:hypothetical protein